MIWYSCPCTKRIDVLFPKDDSRILASLALVESVMKVDHSEVEHVAMLARITLSRTEQDLYSGQLSAILEFFDKLKEIDTTDVAPTSHVLEITNVVRDDCQQHPLDIKDALLNAPDASAGFFRVPKILG